MSKFDFLHRMQTLQRDKGMTALYNRLHIRRCFLWIFGILVKVCYTQHSLYKAQHLKRTLSVTLLSINHAKCVFCHYQQQIGWYDT